ncbi:WXG100 family type VII secretion target [Streptomyces tsukubensis]|uniref:Uncharacterized protein n=1 Tax=Streptomyces tsukubensis TaxID=83656 RepID=A0A1V4A5U4_9ACTN|nr:hypothetical protein [Streptomyces tsukubensis]OON76172.1 hypothetical protein B1H18_21330 [Streptomyces tsukubensis]QFR93698.1 hypothetical protein GBW32_12145 [Streptomyces tsukubensis]
MTEKTIDGHPVAGSYNPDGGFFSEDGKIYVTPSGEVQHGITAPDGHFLPNGEVRTVEGHQFYGMVQSNGSFFSQDGTLWVRPDGTVLHGTTKPDGTFITEKMIDGHAVSGSFYTNGAFFSEDGTVYVDPSGNVEHGITAPDGHFLPNGEVRTVGGQEVYGVGLPDGSFMSQDHTTIVLPEGTVARGTYDQSTGIFTGQNGSHYFLGKGGIQTGSYRGDGALLLTDGSVVRTPESWAVDLAQMANITNIVGNCASLIATSCDTITAQYRTIEGSWASPAGGDFANVATRVESAMTMLNTLLDDTIDRMRITHDNYVVSEEANLRNLGQ